jgi:hypothetical protein
MKKKRAAAVTITQEEVEEWCKANGARLCVTWTECECLWISPDMIKDDYDGGRHMACAACAPQCTECGASYLEVSLNAPEEGKCGECTGGDE